MHSRALERRFGFDQALYRTDGHGNPLHAQFTPMSAAAPILRHRVLWCPVLDAFQGRALGLSFRTQVRMTLQRSRPSHNEGRGTLKFQVKGRATRPRALLSAEYQFLHFYEPVHIPVFWILGNADIPN